MFAIALALNLEERLDSRVATISVVGRSDLSLPVALAFAERRYRVRVLELDIAVKYPPPASVNSDVTVICVPAPFTPEQQPDTAYLVAAARWVAARLRPGQLIVVRSPGVPGMMDQIVRPILESTGLQVGQELFLAVAPAPAIDGNGNGAAEKTPAVARGSDPFSTRLAAHLMQQISP